MKLLETEHRYRSAGFVSADSICLVEVWIKPGELPPLIVATEPPDNHGASVTNMVEYLAAELSDRYLVSELTAGFDPPFLFVERYRRDRKTMSALITDAEEDWSLVTFATYERQLIGSGRNWRYKLGDPDWRHLSKVEFDDLLATYR